MLNIRPCVDADLDALERAFPNGGHAHHAHQAYRTYLVAWDGDDPIGVAVILWDGPYHPDVRAALPGAVEISNVHVHPDHRGHGVGASLIREAEERIDHGTVTVGVAVDNPGAERLYRRLGYTDTGLRWTSAYTTSTGIDVTEETITLMKPLTGEDRVVDMRRG
jgi:ribosomal protein S18 acetylase RimI-like enzyme